MSRSETTLAGPVEIEGIGVHGGRTARLLIEPAPAGAGIAFRLARRRHPVARLFRVRPVPPVDVAADWRNVAATRLATVLSAPGARPVRTVEHLMSALSGLSIDAARITVDGDEVPILDGSAAPFVAALDRAGRRALDAPRRRIRILREVAARSGDSLAVLSPADGDGLALSLAIDFPDEAIGRQSLALDLTPDVFRQEIAPARTFGRARDLRKLRRLGYGRGASLENAVGVDGARVLNPEGLRFADEFVRHKMLDAVGDLALAGLPLAGRFRSEKGGHRLNHAALEALFADPANYRVEVAG